MVKVFAFSKQMIDVHCIYMSINEHSTGILNGRHSIYYQAWHEKLILSRRFQHHLNLIWTFLNHTMHPCSKVCLVNALHHHAFFFLSRDDAYMFVSQNVNTYLNYHCILLQMSFHGYLFVIFIHEKSQFCTIYTSA